MDSEYLRAVMGDALTQCLADVCCKRPHDPIEYMAHWLYKHVNNVDAKKQAIMEVEELERQREQYKLEQELLQKQKEEHERIRKEEELKKVEEEKAAALLAAQSVPSELTPLSETDEPQPTPHGNEDGLALVTEENEDDSEEPGEPAEPQPDDTQTVDAPDDTADGGDDVEDPEEEEDD